MKIIDNKKDYYDYMVYYYGRDNDVVYDRRGSTRVSDELDTFLIQDNELYKRLSIYPSEGALHDYYVCISAGKVNKWAILRVNVQKGKRLFKIIALDEWLSKLNNNLQFPRVKYETKILPNKDKINPNITKETPLCFTILDTSSSLFGICCVVKNPILNNTVFTGIMEPEDIWEGIYNFLLECREPIIEDKRTDIEHLESHGFDKKTSFRKV